MKEYNRNEILSIKHGIKDSNFYLESLFDKYNNIINHNQEEKRHLSNLYDSPRALNELSKKIEENEENDEGTDNFIYVDEVQKLEEELQKRRNERRKKDLEAKKILDDLKYEQERKLELEIKKSYLYPAMNSTNDTKLDPKSLFYSNLSTRIIQPQKEEKNIIVEINISDNNNSSPNIHLNDKNDNKREINHNNDQIERISSPRKKLRDNNNNEIIIYQENVDNEEIGKDVHEIRQEFEVVEIKKEDSAEFSEENSIENHSIKEEKNEDEYHSEDEQLEEIFDENKSNKGENGGLDNMEENVDNMENEDDNIDEEEENIDDEEDVEELKEIVEEDEKDEKIRQSESTTDEENLLISNNHHYSINRISPSKKVSSSSSSEEELMKEDFLISKEINVRDNSFLMDQSTEIKKSLDSPKLSHSDKPLSRNSSQNDSSLLNKEHSSNDLSDQEEIKNGEKINDEEEINDEEKINKDINDEEERNKVECSEENIDEIKDQKDSLNGKNHDESFDEMGTLALLAGSISLGMNDSFIEKNEHNDSFNNQPDSSIKEDPSIVDQNPKEKENINNRESKEESEKSDKDESSSNNDGKEEKGGSKKDTEEKSKSSTSDTEDDEKIIEEELKFGKLTNVPEIAVSSEDDTTNSEYEEGLFNKNGIIFEYDLDDRYSLNEDFFSSTPSIDPSMVILKEEDVQSYTSKLKINTKVIPYSPLEREPTEEKQKENDEDKKFIVEKTEDYSEDSDSLLEDPLKENGTKKRITLEDLKNPRTSASRSEDHINIPQKDKLKKFKSGELSNSFRVWLSQAAPQNQNKPLSTQSTPSIEKSSYYSGFKSHPNFKVETEKLETSEEISNIVNLLRKSSKQVFDDVDANKVSEKRVSSLSDPSLFNSDPSNAFAKERPLSKLLSGELLVKKKGLLKKSHHGTRFEKDSWKDLKLEETNVYPPFTPPRTSHSQTRHSQPSLMEPSSLNKKNEGDVVIGGNNNKDDDFPMQDLRKNLSLNLQKKKSLGSELISTSLTNISKERTKRLTKNDKLNEKQITKIFEENYGDFSDTKRKGSLSGRNSLKNRSKRSTVSPQELENLRKISSNFKVFPSSNRTSPRKNLRNSDDLAYNQREPLTRQKSLEDISLGKKSKKINIAITMLKPIFEDLISVGQRSRHSEPNNLSPNLPEKITRKEFQIPERALFILYEKLKNPFTGVPMRLVEIPKLSLKSKNKLIMIFYENDLGKWINQKSKKLSKYLPIKVFLSDLTSKRLIKSLKIENTVVYSFTHKEKLPKFHFNCFEMSLQELMLNQSKIITLSLPFVFFQMAFKLKELGGFFHEGIFRISPKNDERLNIINQIAKCEYNLNNIKEKRDNCHLIASLIKHFFTCLTEHKKILDIDEIEKLGEINKNSFPLVRKYLNSLPKESQKILKCLSKMMRVIEDNHSYTRMDLKALALVFAPSFYLFENHKNYIKKNDIMIDFLICLFANY